MVEYIKSLILLWAFSEKEILDIVRAERSKTEVVFELPFMQKYIISWLNNCFKLMENLHEKCNFLLWRCLGIFLIDFIFFIITVFK